MNVAQQAWEEATIPRLRDLLARHIPGTGQEDLRSFEWYYSWRQASTAGRTRRINLSDGACRIAFSPNGDRLAVAHTFGPMVTLIDTKRATVLETVGSVGRPRWSHTFAAFSSDGKLLAYPSFDWRSVRLRDVGRCHRTRTVLQPTGQKSWVPLMIGDRFRSRDRHFTFDPRQVTAAAFSPSNGAVLAVGDADGVLRIGDMHTGKTTRVFHLKDAIHAVVFSRDGAMIGATSVQGDLKVWELLEGCERYSDVQNGAYNAIAFSPGGETFVSSGSEDVRVVNLNTRESRAQRDRGWHSGILSQRRTFRNGRE